MIGYDFLSNHHANLGVWTGEKLYSLQVAFQCDEFFYFLRFYFYGIYTPNVTFTLNPEIKSCLL